MFPFYEIFGFNVPKWGYLITNDTVFVCSDTHTHINIHVCVYVCSYVLDCHLNAKDQNHRWSFERWYRYWYCAWNSITTDKKGSKSSLASLAFFVVVNDPPGEKWPIWKWTEASINWRRTLAYKQQVPVILLRRGLLFGLVLKGFLNYLIFKIIIP